MTLYAEYKTFFLTIFQRHDNTWVVRLRPHLNKKVGLTIAKGDTILVTTKSDIPKFLLKVGCFVPHVYYGRYVTTGHIIVDWIVPM
jgi:hypothetical protein